MEIESVLAQYFPLRESQMGFFTDSIVVRNLDSGACGLASCIYIEWSGSIYAISCHHVLKEGHEYITGAKRITGTTIDEGDTHAVAPVRLAHSSEELDLALFELDGLDITTIPKGAVDLSAIPFTRQVSETNLACLSFIHGVPGFASAMTQYEDGLVFMSSPVYSGCGPIVHVEEDLVVGDFAEKECYELNTSAFPRLEDFQPTGGARHLGGMSGSGIWVIYEEHFCLLGILLGAAADNDPNSEHRIRFTPVWKVKEWLQEVIG